MAPHSETWEPAAGRGAPPWLGYALGLAPLAFFAWCLTRLPAIARGEAVEAEIAWAPSLDLTLSLYLDGLGMAFALLISGIGVLVLWYTGAYLKGHPRIGQMYLWLLLFMASMLGVVLSGNLIALFVFWELTSLCSYMLIGFEHQRGGARNSALQALLVTGLGGLALLAGLILLGLAAGTFEIRELLARGEIIQADPRYPAILALVLIGAFTKSAQFPFHFWLPNAMEAPTPASAYLHSSTMVKAGVFLLARFYPALGGTDAWLWAVTSAGAATMLVSGWLALRQSVLKPLLAYTTVNALGIMTVCLGLGVPGAVKAFVVFLFVHAFYKAALFMVAGAIDHETGEKDTEKLGGLGRLMPLTAAGAALAGLSMAGLPPFLGFIGKEKLYEFAVAAPVAAAAIAAVMVAANAVNGYAALAVAWKPFWTRRLETPKPPHEGSFGLWGGPLLLGLLGLAAGLIPSLLAPNLLGPAAASVLGAPAEVKLALWHGFNLPLLLSAVTLALGIALYAFRAPVRRALALLSSLDAIGPEAAYHAGLHGMQGFARFQTRVIQNGYLRYYLLTVIGFILAVPAFTLVSRGGVVLPDSWPALTIYEGIICSLIVVAAVYITLTTSRLAAVAALGVIGFGVSLVYVLYGAPDLAMTQFLIETLTVLLFVLVLHKLPVFSHFTSDAERYRDMVAAGLAGLFMTGLTIYAMQADTGLGVSQYYMDHSVEQAHGRNVVNVILVDFRALDTLGEITVLAVAALGAFGLLRLRNLAHAEEHAAEERAAAERGEGGAWTR